VSEVVVDALSRYSHAGSLNYPTYAAQRERLRATLASLIGAKTADLGLVPNTTAGVMHVALCFPWKKGDRVVVFDGEFPANVIPWRQAAETFDLDLRVASLEPFFRSHEEGLASLESLFGEEPALVAVSSVEFQSGLRMPIAGIAERAHAVGAAVFVDAIQSIGAVPCDVARDRVDFLACGSHKHLMAIEGAGFLYVAPTWIERLVPRTAGWLSVEEPAEFLFQGHGHLRYDREVRRETSFVEGGTQNVLGYAALEASTDLIVDLGVERIFEHVARYHDALEPELVARGFGSLRTPWAEGRSTLLSVRPPDRVDVTVFHRALVAEGVVAAIPDGNVRFSPHWPNALDEVPYVVGAVERALRVASS
jgi:selenocysteine lyase/cysteine desulfurase